MMKTTSHAPASHAGGGALWFYYDAENQLTQVTSNNVAGFITQWQTFLAYDGRQRLRLRIERAPAAPAGGPAARSGGVVPLSAGWVTNSVTEYLYDGMRVIQERNQYNTPTVSYTRGTDLSGSMEGAGGIGGLLARSHGYSAGNWSKHNYYHADGNGNVTYLVNSSQTLAARYRYDAYGNLLSIWESFYNLGTANTYRFSSKEVHLLTGLYYYGYRWYAPNVQRWLNRDPVGVVAGINLFAFNLNDPVNAVDPDGQSILGCFRAIKAWQKATDDAVKAGETSAKDQTAMWSCINDAICDGKCVPPSNMPADKIQACYSACKSQIDAYRASEKATLVALAKAELAFFKALKACTGIGKRKGSGS